MTRWLIDTLGHLAGDESGQGLVEYGVMLALIAVACIASLHTFGTDLKALFQQASDAYAGAHGGQR